MIYFSVTYEESLVFLLLLMCNTYLHISAPKIEKIIFQTIKRLLTLQHVLLKILASLLVVTFSNCLTLIHSN